MDTDHERTKDTPYLALAGKLWGAIVRILGEIDRVITGPHCIYALIWVFIFFNKRDPGGRLLKQSPGRRQAIIWTNGWK